MAWDHFKGIDKNAVDRNIEVAVTARRIAGISNKADNVACFHHIPYLDVEPAAVPIASDDSILVLDCYKVSKAD